jgi:hypothetical protein
MTNGGLGETTHVLSCDPCPSRSWPGKRPIAERLCVSIMSSVQRGAWLAVREGNMAVGAGRERFDVLFRAEPLTWVGRRTPWPMIVGLSQSSDCVCGQECVVGEKGEGERCERGDMCQREASEYRLSQTTHHVEYVDGLRVCLR